MGGLRAFFRCLGEAVCNKGLRGLIGAIPFGDAVFDIAADAHERLKRFNDMEQVAFLEETVRANALDVKIMADAVAAEVAHDQPPEVQLRLAACLSQIPGALRRSRRGVDPAAPITFALKKAEDLLQFLPVRPPRFQPGDRPPGVGDWELVELLGVGGFGEVWKARHVYFDGIAPVALKFCLDANARDRLLKHEAAVLNQVMRQGRHPGIVPLLDAYLSADPPCLKYEFVGEGDLSGLIRTDEPAGKSRWREATQLVRALAEIVGFAHRLTPPIVHRDLKPANILLAARGSDKSVPLLKITDFGIGGVAALPLIRASQQGTTSAGAFLGTALRGSHTPLYASPQQMRGEPPEPRDDVHALGVIWYQLLTGDLASGAPTGLWSEDLEDAEMPRELIRLLGACVAAKAEKRPVDAAELAERLATALGAPSAKPEAPPPPPVDDKLDVLLRAACSNSFGVVDLTNKQIGDDGLRRLAASPLLAKASALYLNGNQVTDAGVAALAASPHLQNLNNLVLWDNHIGDEGVAALAASPQLKNLTALNLGKNRVGDDGVQALATSPYLTNLTALILVDNHIGDVGALALADSAPLAGLAELKPLGNRITALGVTALRTRFGKRVRIY